MHHFTIYLLSLILSVKAFAPSGTIHKLHQVQAVTKLSSQNSVNEADYDISLFSPCKINLFLRIIRKRQDGYHDLASLFQTINFGDMLYLKLEPPDAGLNQDTFECNMAGVPTDKSNLVIRALDLVREKTGNTDKFFKVNLYKNVPAQAGLGGGSGNAAAAMWGANELLGKPATLEQLVEWSGALGSDITFFLSQGTAYCTGRGEIMTPVQNLPDGTKVCIVKPDIGLSTPEVFKALKYDQLSTVNPEELLDTFMKKGAVGASSDAYVNDLEQPAFDCLPQLKALKDELLAVEGFDHVMMSGSGTSIFCIGEPKDWDKFQKTFGEREGINVFPAEFCSRKEGVWFERP
jgi:4-diphosphocytidyl-2-C-methyl-D-erythritol kinase